MINRILRKYRTWRLAKTLQNEVLQDGTLLNAFYKSKTIFIHIPKTAGISLINAVYGDIKLSGHRNFYFNCVALGFNNDKYFSFSFVRNPFDRLYSAYMFLKDGGINHHDKLSFETHLSEFKDFEDFVLNGLDKNLIFQVAHLIPQYEYLCDKRGVILVDFLGRFESLEEDVYFLSKRLKKDIRLAHYNFNKKQHYINAYTSNMIKKVHKVYQKDIAIFGYSFK